MIKLGIGNDGHIINGVLVNAGNPTTLVGTTGYIEVRDCKIVSLQLIVSAFTGAFTGNWKIEGSNNYNPSMGTAAYGQPSNVAGDWDDLTAVFSDAVQPTPAPTVAAITANGNQIVFSPPHLMGVRALRVSVTRT